MTDDEQQALQEGFDTHRLLDAVDDVDTLRQSLSDDGIKPPEIRDRLLQLHQLAMAVINQGSHRKAPALFDLASELEDEAFEIMEAATRLHEVLSTLTGLRPNSLDDGERDD